MRLRFGKLRLALPHEMRGTHLYVLCKCDCGADVWMRYEKLDRRQSCGCIARERPRSQRRPRGPRPPDTRKSRQAIVAEHLMSTHSSWRSMKKRCSEARKPNTRYARWYAGVSVCDRWRASFDAFVEDMGPRPSKSHTLDRYPNNSGDYEPGNCRWATLTQQNNNRRPRRPRVTLPFEGRRIGVMEMAQLSGLEQRSVRQRMSKGWSAEQIISTPPRRLPHKAA